MSTAQLMYELPAGGRVLFSERAHGNVSSVGGDDAEHGENARERLRELAGVRALARGYQVHGTVVRRVCEVPARAQQQAPTPAVRADGQATTLALVGAMVVCADCLPIALGSDGAVAIVHAGWRGLAAGVLEEGVRALRELGGEGSVRAVIGPGAGACCYEVGPEVHAAFGRTSEHARHLDLRAIARERLRAAGVRDVHDVALCTICDERFFSHRREGARAGRQAGIAWLS